MNKKIETDIAEIKEALTLLLIYKKVLTFKEAARYLNFSESYLYKLTSAGIIPYSKPNNKTLFFDREKLDVWMLSNSSTSKEQKDVAAATYVSTHN